MIKNQLNDTMSEIESVIIQETNKTVTDWKRVEFLEKCVFALYDALDYELFLVHNKESVNIEE